MVDVEGDSGILASPMVDVSGMTLADVTASDHSVVANSLRRILSEVEHSAQAISGWSSYVGVD